MVKASPNKYKLGHVIYEKVVDGIYEDIVERTLMYETDLERFNATPLLEEECEHYYDYGWGNETGQYSRCKKCGYVKKYTPKPEKGKIEMPPTEKEPMIFVWAPSKFQVWMQSITDAVNQLNQERG